MVDIMISEVKFKKYLESFDVDIDTCVSNLRSLSRTISIYEYHKSMAYELIKKLEPSSNREALKLILEPSVDIEVEKLAVQAHIHSAIYNARALYDIFAQLLNKVILKEEFSVSDCSLYKVRNLIEEPVLKSLLNSVVKSESYKYTNAFVNTIKHRDLVSVGANLDLINNRSGLKFQSFIYNKDTFPSLWEIEVLEYSLNSKNDIIALFSKFEQHTLDS